MPRLLKAAGSNWVVLLAALASAGCGKNLSDCEESSFADVRLGGIVFRVNAAYTHAIAHGFLRSAIKKGPNEYEKTFCLRTPGPVYESSTGIGLNHDELKALPAKYATLSYKDVSQVVLFEGGLIEPPVDFDKYEFDPAAGIHRREIKDRYQLYGDRLTGWDYYWRATCSYDEGLGPEPGDSCLLHAYYAPTASLRISVTAYDPVRWVEILTAAKLFYDDMQEAAGR